MSAVKLYLYTEQEVIAVFENTEGEILAPENTQQKIVTEEEAITFFEEHGIELPDHLKSLYIKEFPTEEPFQMEETIDIPFE